VWNNILKVPKNPPGALSEIQDGVLNEMMAFVKHLKRYTTENPFSLSQKLHTKKFNCG